MLNMLQINEAIKDIGPLLPLINQPPLKEVGIMTNQTIAEMFQSGNLKDIPGYEGLYAASRDGRIWSYPKWGSSKNGMWLKQQKYTNSADRIKPRSHYNVPLRKNGKRSLLQVHRLIGLTYIPNPDNLPQINHQNCNPLINDVDNLEWSDELGLGYSGMYRRIVAKKWPAEKAFETPVQPPAVIVKHNGESKSISQWGRDLEIPTSTIQNWISTRGMSIDEVIEYRSNL